MRVLRVIVLTWLIAAGGVLAGWALGRPFGRQELFLGGVVLGTLAILLAIRMLAAWGWFNPDRRRGGSIGGLCGFALAAPLAAMAIDAPVFAFLAMALVGIGVIAGAGPSAAR